jgi:uncharacterized protein
MKIENKITKQKLDKYFSITEKALKKLKIANPKKTHLEKTALDFLDIATRYFKDAKYFEKKGDFVNAFACLNYSYGWLDSGARLGLFDVEHDNILFTVD